MLRMMSEQSPDKLGIGLQITKANDMPPKPIQALSYLFDSTGLALVEKAKLEDFPGLLAASNESGEYKGIDHEISTD